MFSSLWDKCPRVQSLGCIVSTYLILFVLKPARLGIFLVAQWLRICLPGFPGGAVVESLPANAGDTGSSPGLGRSHMPRSNKVREPQLLSLRVWSLCSATREAATVRGPRTAMKSGPRSPQLEKACAQKLRPNTAKNKLINLKKKLFKKKKKKNLPANAGDTGSIPGPGRSHMLRSN